MNIIDRAKGMILAPAAEWQAVERESTTPQQVLTGYVVPLAAAGALIVMIVSALAGLRLITAGFIAISTFLSAIAGCIAGAFIADGFATTFGGRSDRTQAFRLMGYAFTAVLVANLIPIPYLGAILRFAAAIYSIYVLYLGIPVLMKAPADKAVPYTLVLIVVLLIVTWIVSMILGMMLITGSMFTDDPFRIV